MLELGQVCCAVSENQARLTPCSQVVALESVDLHPAFDQPHGHRAETLLRARTRRNMHAIERGYRLEPVREVALERAQEQGATPPVNLAHPAHVARQVTAVDESRHGGLDGRGAVPVKRVLGR